MKDARLLAVIVFAGERTLRPGLTGDLILLRRQLGAPLLIRLGDFRVVFVHHGYLPATRLDQNVIYRLLYGDVARFLQRKLDGGKYWRNCPRRGRP